MMHVKFYAISVLFLIAVGACFLLIAFGHGPDSGIAADNDHSGIINPAKPLTDNSVDRVSSEQVQPGKEPRVLRPGL